MCRVGFGGVKHRVKIEQGGKGIKDKRGKARQKIIIIIMFQIQMGFSDFHSTSTVCRVRIVHTSGAVLAHQTEFKLFNMSRTP